MNTFYVGFLESNNNFGQMKNKFVYEEEARARKYIARQCQKDRFTIFRLEKWKGAKLLRTEMINGSYWND